MYRMRQSNDHDNVCHRFVHNAYLSPPNLSLLLPPANEVWGKVIFLHLFVILFTGGVWSQGGACSWGGLIPEGCLLQGRPWSQGGASRLTPKGKLRVIRFRPTPKGEIQGGQVQAHTQGGNSGGSGPALSTATAVGGTRPTGMHSCWRYSENI